MQDVEILLDSVKVFCEKPGRVMSKKESPEFLLQSLHDCKVFSLQGIFFLFLWFSTCAAFGLTKTLAYYRTLNQVTAKSEESHFKLHNSVSSSMDNRCTKKFPCSFVI